MNRDRLINIDFAKGFTIILVVIGHILTQANLEGNEWFKFIHRCIYRFHMPLFMFLSGVIFYFNFKIIHSFEEYKNFILKKTFRLMPAFFLFGLLILLGKILVSQFMYVDDVPQNIFHTLIQILINPYSSPAGSLWYIYVLFEYYLIMSIVYSILKKNTLILIFLSVFIFLISVIFKVPETFALHLFTEYFLFFNLGAIYIKYRESLNKVFSNYGIIFIVTFFISFYMMGILSGPLNKLLISLFSIPAILAFHEIIRNNNKYEKFFLYIGEYTFTIYLMNTIFIGLLKGLLFKLFPWHGINFLIYLPILTVGGVFLPIISYNLIFARIKFLSKIAK